MVTGECAGLMLGDSYSVFHWIETGSRRLLEMEFHDEGIGVVWLA
jgi:hypothetical protein